MPFTPHLQLLLDPASTLPLHLDLGEHSYSWENGKFNITSYMQQPGFRKLTRDELMQLMRRLHAAPHAVLLNLYGHDFGEGAVHETLRSDKRHRRKKGRRSAVGGRRQDAEDCEEQLVDNKAEGGVMQEMAAPIAALSQLQALVLSCTRPLPPICYCFLHAHVSITTAAATATPSLAPWAVFCGMRL